MTVNHIINNLSDYAIIVNSKLDNIAIAAKKISADVNIIYNKHLIDILCDILPGERFALNDIPHGDYVYQYGFPFAMSKGILAGQLVDINNTINEIPPYKDVDSFAFQEKGIKEFLCEKTFMGYKREDGRCGTRNYYIIVPTSMCASAVAQQIASRFSDKIWGIDAVIALPNTEGCGCASGMQIDRFLTVLKNCILHQNVAGAFIVDLGCEQTNCAVVKSVLDNEKFNFTEKIIDWITIQKAGGSAKAISMAVETIAARLKQFSSSSREICPLSALTLGTECGGSDAFSGITANRVIGSAVNQIISYGGSALLSEFPEMIGVEQIIYPRMRNRAIREKFIQQMNWYKDMADRLGVSMDNNLVPENKAGGLINPYIKSLGAVMKGGDAVIEDVIDYGERIKFQGLNIMQGPGNDLESVTGLAASGANIICFSTGRGTVTGCALVPVIKISSTTELFNRMSDDIDINAGIILDNSNPAKTLLNLGEFLIQYIIDVASGKKTKPEINRQFQFQIWTAGKLSL